MSAYDGFAPIYDAWFAGTEDVDFYVELAADADGPVVELAVGTGRVAIPIVDLDRQAGRSRPQAGMTLYDRIAGFYDPWSRSVTEDVGFYVDQALASGGPVVELAVGTGRIAIPVAQAGVPVIGVDSSPEMLAIARAAVEAARVADRLDLRLGDLRDPPVSERVPLVICPFRSLLHMETEIEKLGALAAARSLLEPDGRYVFDVFAPSRDDIDETHDRWLEREPGIFERAVWDEGSRTLSLSVRSGDATATFGLHWLSAPEWLSLLDRAGFAVEAVYGWFDSRPFEDEEDMIFVCRAR